MLGDSGSMEMGQKDPGEDGALTLEWAARQKGIFLTGGWWTEEHSTQGDTDDLGFLEVRVGQSLKAHRCEPRGTHRSRSQSGIY